MSFTHAHDRRSAKYEKQVPEEKVEGLQYASRLAGHFDRWMEMAKVEKTYDALRNLITSEEFRKGCSPALLVFLKERSCKKLSTLAQNADCFLEAQDISSLSKDKSYKDNAVEISRQTESAKIPPRGHTMLLMQQDRSSCM
ncbi:hypothetical protein HPB49_004557 [Dermacentor silvarum]|uniref:Uncharacterized protein n=1 Tax=Dermacentor silvarum TaxID=543639 RepID=A0ACB8DAX4_DERSI|nr:hypothetical protein HPB49_004557 [Dermacentor silvarum]